MNLQGLTTARPLGLEPPKRPLSPLEKVQGAPSTQGKFIDLMTNQVKSVNDMQMNAETMMQSLLTGGDVNEAEVLTSIQKADLAFRMLLQVRNKLIEAYREVQQIQF